MRPNVWGRFKEFVVMCLTRDRRMMRRLESRWAWVMRLPGARLLLARYFQGFTSKRLRVGPVEVALQAPRHSYVAGRSSGVDQRGAFEAPLAQRFMESLDESSVVWDIGAGIGIYARAATERTRQPVLVVEPDPTSQLYLRRNLAGRPYRLITKFVGETDDAVTATLDQILAEGGLSPTHLKMDIEGAEIGAINGAQHLLRSRHPMVFVEFHERLIREEYKLDAAAIAEFFAGLRQLGYVLSFNGHHYAMHTSSDGLYDYAWHADPPNPISYALVAVWTGSGSAI